MLALIAPLLVWRLRMVQGALREDQGGVVDMVEAAVSGRPPVRPRLRLAESEALLARLDSLLRARTARPVVPVPPPASPEEPPVSTRAAPDKTAIDRAFGRVRPAAAARAGASALPADIFMAYDIRGVAGKTLTPEVMTLLGRAIGSEAYEHGQQTVILGRDCRESGAALAEALAQGLRASGRDVVDLGMVPTPLLYFATRFLGSDCGVMVTGSHNPPEYNGLKLELGGEAVNGERLQALARRVERGDLLQGDGAYRTQNLLADYVDRVASDVRLARPMKLVVDCGNGSAGGLVPALLRTLGCEVVELYCEPDGRFPNHQPDPSRPENLADLSSAVRRQAADLGLAFDGDGDRLGVVDTQGKIIWPDRLLMLLAQDVLSRQPGADIIYDVKSTRDLASYILLHGGCPLMWKSGHSLMRAKLKETGALLAGELSGHIFFEERWYGFDDGPYAAARLLEILSEDPRSPAEVFAELPESLSTPELLVATPKGNQHELARRMAEKADLKGATLTTIDGLRAELAKGWGLVRASNTTPHLMFRFEADDAAGLAEIETLFRTLALSVDPDLELPF
jgi:phosphomannomutase/phosphoglucomutase